MTDVGRINAAFLDTLLYLAYHYNIGSSTLSSLRSSTQLVSDLSKYLNISKSYEILFLMS